MGQMLRGGRSWPSERKLGAGAERRGKTAAERFCGAATAGALLSNGVAEQNAEHRLQLSETVDVEVPPSPVLPPLAASVWCECWWSPPWPTALMLSWPRWPLITTSAWLPNPAGGHSMAAAIAPRTGSNTASNSKSQMRIDFTDVRLAGQLCPQSWV